MKKSLLKVTENNPGVRFVVVAKNEGELESITSFLEENEYDPIPPITVREMMHNAKRECGFPVGIRIDPNPKLVCFASIDHWRERTKDILEFENGKFRFIEGCE